MNSLFTVVVLGFLLICAIATCLTRNLLVSVVIYMAYSVLMSIMWMLLQSPDLGPSPKRPWARASPASCFLSCSRRPRHQAPEGGRAE